MSDFLGLIASIVEAIFGGKGNTPAQDENDDLSLEEIENPKEEGNDTSEL